jgi:hypothetical protein
MSDTTNSLTIQADELIMALENSDLTMHNYLDLQTGEIVFTSDFMDMDEEIAPDLEGEPDRYRAIEGVSSSVSFDVMSDFVDSLSPGETQEELIEALRRKRPFRNFKDTLFNYPKLREQWFRFHEEAFIEIAKEWLKDNSIEATLARRGDQQQG